MILNLTQHNATPAQVEAGVVEPPQGLKARIAEALTVGAIPTSEELSDRADALADLVFQYNDAAPDPVRDVMIGGAPFLMAMLESALVAREFRPLYAFSRRESVDEHQSDGTVVKRQVFRHLGFVNPYD